MPAKSHITAHRAHSPLEWREKILTHIAAPHIQRWVASVIAWDYQLEDCLALLDLADGYNHDEANGYDYEQLADGLRAVGYAQVDVRMHGQGCVA